MKHMWRRQRVYKWPHVVHRCLVCGLLRASHQRHGSKGYVHWNTYALAGKYLKCERTPPCPTIAIDNRSAA